ncbi:methionyl-tRNA formyltransferase [Mycoplasmopsis canis]|uniref:methionyl-tRNA formyltransferase n=1 Tax=Mycoplasmopsis canis TaxID=29555 RepID=UPI00025AFC2B|nr:methionyl-tRNA formyltransferase [Mycoplasmopsis canis]EIE40315.1 methionyl-tRNA formyltransferase [Mycoplasmopsis canis UF33]
MNKPKEKIVLAGTPEFSVPVFEEIIRNFNVVAIISQPDKPANRGYKIEPTPTKLLAQKYNIKVFQPNKIGEIYEELKELEYDIMISCAFGQYIPMKVLELAKIASINIHGSLLPKYRGAAPIQYSLLNGDSETGITLIYMTKAMDAGDMIFSERIKISEFDTSDSLFQKISILAKNVISDWINRFIKNDFIAQKQNESEVILSPKLLKEDALLIDSLTTFEAFNKIRAFSSNPGAYIILNGKRVKIYYATRNKVPNSIEIKFADGSLYATDYQYESKKRINLLK